MDAEKYVPKLRVILFAYIAYFLIKTSMHIETQTHAYNAFQREYLI